MPPPHTFPSRCANSFFPFLAGTRQCAGMYLAEAEVLVMLYAFLVAYDVKVDLPAVVALPPGGDGGAASCSPPGPAVIPPLVDGGRVVEGAPQGIGGGTALGCAKLLARPAPGSAIAVVSDPLATTTGGVRHVLVKRPDMFTGVDGVIPFTIGRRRSRPQEQREGIRG